MLVDAVAGLQAGDITDAQRYLQFTAEHRGAAVAEQAKARLRHLQRAESWQGCRLWVGWGYKHKPPPAPPAPAKPKPKAKPRGRK